MNLWPSRRVVSTTLLFLALGLVTSIAVAWCAALYLGLFTHSPSMGMGDYHRGKAIMAIETTAVARDNDETQLYWHTDPVLEPPFWSRMKTTPTERGLFSYQVAAGWPFYCLTFEGFGRHPYANHIGHQFEGEIYGLFDRPLPRGGAYRLEYLPRRPIVINLLLDVAFWGLIWLMIFNLHNVWRINLWLRRRPKSRCAWCGYIVSGSSSERCSECGQEIGKRPTLFTPPWRWPAVLLLILIVLGEIVFIERFVAGRVMEPIHRASIQGDLDKVKTELAKGVDIDFSITSSWMLNDTPLILASSHGHEDVVLHLLESGAEKTSVSQNGNALTCALYARHLDLAYALIDHGVPVNLKIGGFQEPLWAAVKIGDLTMIDSLISLGADPKLVSPWGMSLVLILVGNRDLQTENRKQILARLLEAGADPGRTITARFQSPLGKLISSRNLELAQMLLDAGAIIDFSALSKAVWLEDKEALLFLENQGADFTLTQPMWGTSLLWSCHPANRSVPAMWKFLVEHDADVNTVIPTKGNTLLINEVIEHNLERVRFLLDHGADPRIRNKQGKKAMDYADTDELQALLKQYEILWTKDLLSPIGDEEP
ncbi:MAG: ankyrin repeat domain-containing protein [Planctomycetota bacterium]|nr:ankyrin repeat domain-containing protein [Planctomycetota bacterium]